MRNDKLHTMLFTHNEEDALRLKCAFLPGQYAGIQECDRQRFAEAVLFALSEAMRKSRGGVIVNSVLRPIRGR